MSDARTAGFAALSQQGALILTLATAIWCLSAQVGLVDSLFRSVVVYLAVSIIGLVARGQLTRLTAADEDGAAAAESGESAGETKR